MVAINPQKIEGRWRSGYALDLHTTSSTPVGHNESGHMRFDTVRPPIAELLYQLKYQHNQAAAQEIIDAAAGFLHPYKNKFDLIIPVPASTIRSIQPVAVLAYGIGAAIGLQVKECVVPTRATTQLKGVTDPAKRRELLDGLYAVDPIDTVNKNVLLFDDLFRSGSTMNAITEVLYGQGRAGSVCALTITCTRSNR